MIRRFRAPNYVVSVWPLAITLTGAFLLWLVLFGDPLEIVELRWLGQLLRWRAAAGVAPAVDPHVVHLDIDRHEFESFSTISLEYQNAANIIREAAALGQGLSFLTSSSRVVPKGKRNRFSMQSTKLKEQALTSSWPKH